MIELVGERTRTAKIYAVDDPNMRKAVVKSCPIHFENALGMMEDISNDLLLTSSSKQFNHYLREKHDFTVGYREDCKSNKYLGVRRGTGKQFEVTPDRLTINNKDIIIPAVFPQILNPVSNEIEHIIDDDTCLWSRITSTSIITAVKTKLWVESFKIVNRIFVKGFVVLNDKVGNMYIPDENNCFIFVDPENPMFKMCIRQPEMWNSHSKCNGIEHTLVDDGDSLIYTKEPNDKGIEWLLLNDPIFYIDASATIYTTTGSSFDGYITHINGGNDTVDNTGNALYFTNQNDKIQSWQRSYLGFDISGITGKSSAALTDGTIYIDATPIENGTKYAKVYRGVTYTSTIATTDWANLSENISTMTITSTTSGTYSWSNSSIFNSNIASEFKSNSILRIVLTANDEASTGDLYGGYCYSKEKGSSYAPYITLTYSVPLTAYVFMGMDF